MANPAKKFVEAIDPHWDVIRVVNNHSDEVRKQTEEEIKHIVMEKYFKEKLRRRRIRKTMNNVAYFMAGIGVLGAGLFGLAKIYLLQILFLIIGFVSATIIYHTET